MCCRLFANINARTLALVPIRLGIKLLGLQGCAEASQQLAGLEVVVEQPFALDCRFSAPPRVQSIMPPQPEPSQPVAPATTTPRAAVVLPLGPPAVMLVCITAVAPCQVDPTTFRVTM